MLFYYIRHGDPIYSPDSLTPLGERQAEAVGKRLAQHGLDKIYASTSERAKLTAKPACEMLKKEMELLDFANEGHAWRDLSYTIKLEDGTERHNWLIDTPGMRVKLSDPSVIALGHEWYTHPMFEGYDYKKGIDRIRENADELFKKHGYEHIPGTGMYKITEKNDSRIALFAHAGFGLAFMSCILDIPYPQFAIHFDMQHSGLTVVNFADVGEGYAVPRVLTYSNDSHIYKENLPLRYNNGTSF